MNVHVRHRIGFRYDRPVFLEPMTVRLRPRQDVTQRLIDYSLLVDPAPTGRSAITDAAGNPAEVLWFDGLTGGIVLSAEWRAETLRENPFDFLVTDPTALAAPVSYAADEHDALACYRGRAEQDAAVDAWAGELLQAAAGQVLEFLALSADQVRERCTSIIRLEGDSHTPGETLRRQEGACRDLTVLWIDLCRSLGLAARFVSGFKIDEDAADQRELHAWGEVYLPGGGWRGYDPSLGLAVADQHVALAAAAEPHGAAPTSGAFRGTDAKSTMDYAVDVQATP